MRPLAADQHRARSRITLPRLIRGSNPIGTKAAEILAFFAPRAKNPDVVEEAQHDRPDHTIRWLTLRIQISDPQFALAANGRTQAGERHGIDRKFLHPRAGRV